MAIPAHPFPTGPRSRGTAVHVHCARCGVVDDTVAATVVRGGTPWPPTCARCSAEVREKSARLAALRYVTDGAA